MKKLENLNKDLFKGFEKKGISDLHKIYGGNVATCTTDHCQDVRSGTVADPDERISISNQDC
ncbi:MAG TPA: hypothetical protein PLL00_14995 [Bacteroidia bacterium]|nr:hypothetical protein [Bacteroidia bacterium]